MAAEKTEGNSHMYVVTHLDNRQDIPTRFRAIFAGAAGKTVPEGMLSDAAGDNISAKNGDYCELTAIYWVWKNIQIRPEDNIGFCHYRRYFGMRPHSMSEKYYLDEAHLPKVMGQHKVILTKPIHYMVSEYDILSNLPSKEDLKKVRRAMEEVCPEYLPTYDAYMANNVTWRYNMFVMKGKMFQDFCAWMFPILKKTEEMFPQKGEEGYIPRMYGYLSEHLVGIWVMHHVPRKQVLEMRMVLTPFGRYYGFVESFLRPRKDRIRNLIFHVRKLTHGKKR